MPSLAYKFRLLRGLLSGERARVGPFIALIYTTRRCNLRCPGCRYHSAQVGTPSPGDQTVEDIPPLLVERLCDQLEAMGTTEIVFTGDGEPFLHPDLPRIVSAATSRAFHTTLFTNGTLLHGESAQRLVGSGLDVLTVSLWAASQEDYPLHYPGTDRGMFGTVTQNLRHLSALKERLGSALPSIRLYQPINRHNLQSIHRMVDLARDTGCNELFFSPFRARSGKLDSLALTPEDTACAFRALRQIKRRLAALDMRTNVDQALQRYRIGNGAWEKIPCYAAWVQAHIKPDGSVFPCSSWASPLGNLHEKTFAEMWNGRAFHECRTRMLSPSGRARVRREIDCGFCAQLRDNLRIDQVFRWLSPLRRGTTEFPCSE